MKKRLDSRRGRKPRAAYGRMALSAGHYERIFTPGLWKRLWPLLRVARNEAGVGKAFRRTQVPDLHYFVPSLASLILGVIRDPSFPKREPAQIRHFVDSIAGRGVVSPRRSRDIMQASRAEAKRAHHIVRFEFYVVCSCGYEGPALNSCCAECSAPIIFPIV